MESQSNCSVKESAAALWAFLREHERELLDNEPMYNYLIRNQPGLMSEKSGKKGFVSETSHSARYRWFAFKGVVDTSARVGLMVNLLHKLESHLKKHKRKLASAALQDDEDFNAHEFEKRKSNYPQFEEVQESGDRGAKRKEQGVAEGEPPETSPTSSAPLPDAPLEPEEDVADLPRPSTTALVVWTCPVDGCGHQMGKESAGKRAHMRRRHTSLCNMPCPRTPPCAHGCKECVPHEVLFQGRPARSSTADPSMMSPTSASSSQANLSRTPRVSASSSQAMPSASSGTACSSQAKLPRTACRSASSRQAAPSASSSTPSSSKTKTSMPRTSAQGCKAKASLTSGQTPSSDEDMPLAARLHSADKASTIKRVRSRLKPGKNSPARDKRSALAKLKSRSFERRRLGKLSFRQKQAQLEQMKEDKTSFFKRWREAVSKLARTECLPEDVPLDHESRTKLIFQRNKRTCIVGKRSKNRLVRFQVTLAKAGGDLDACAHIARLCYAKAMEGANKEDILAYREELYNLMKGLKQKAMQMKRALSSSLTPASLHGEKKGKERCLEDADSTACDQEKSAAAATGAKAKSKAKPLDSHCGNLEEGFEALFATFGEVEEGAEEEEDEDANAQVAAKAAEEAKNTVDCSEQEEKHCLEPALCRLEASQLLALLRQGAEVEAVLRGVPPERQVELLALMDDTPNASLTESDMIESYEVPLGAGTKMAEERAGLADAWTDLALDRGMQWPFYSELPSLRRSDLADGLGPTDDFSLGVVVGPSGSGVTRLLLRLASDLGLPPAPCAQFRSDQSVASQFDDAVSMLPMVGLNSVPAWMRPYHVLSNGQQQRVRLGLYMRSGAVIDDFGSGIGQQEVRSVANSIGKFIRKQHLSKVLIGTHSQDALPFLQPDFVICVDGKWSANPNPSTHRCTTVSLEAAFMGRLQQPGDDPPPDAAEAYEYASQEAWPGAVKVKRSTVEVRVQLDQRTLNAANAFEHDFEGIARCDIPVLPQSRLPPAWLLGLVIGPSGTGKTTTIRNFCRAQDLVVDDGEDAKEGITVFSHVATACDSADIAEEVLQVCQLPISCWLARLSSLSRSELWRASLATRLATSRKGSSSTQMVVVVDEFTTQLDRYHARSLCKALSTYVHTHQMRLLCATVHDDVVPWLRPCWVFDTARAEFAGLQGEVIGASGDADEPMDTLAMCDPTDLAYWHPPVVRLDIQQVAATSSPSVWQDQFKDHHYLTGSLNCLNDGCFVVKERGTGSFAALHASSILPGAITSIREHRLVVRPEWQGFGIGPKLSNFLASRWCKATADQKRRFSSKTAHPRLGDLRQQDPRWCPSSQNLVISTGESFGYIGTFDGKSLPRYKFPHGVEIKVRCRAKRCFYVTMSFPPMQVKTDMDIPMTKNIDIEKVLGIAFHGNNLLIDSLDPGGSASSAQRPNLIGRWALDRVNQHQINSRAEVLEVLRKYAAVESLTLRKTRQDSMSGPDRASESEAEADMKWIRLRCVAQDSLMAEIEQVHQLILALIVTEKKLKLALRPPPSSRRGRPPSRLPPLIESRHIPEVPLEVLPHVHAAAQKCVASRKDRICYSHFYVGEEGAWWEKHPNSIELYQLWMWARVPELRDEGHTHQAAIETAIEEWKIHFVIRFDWSDVEASCGPQEGGLQLLGLAIGQECQVVEVLEDGFAKVNKIKMLHSQSSAAGIRLRAIRRGACKINVGSLDQLSAGMATLQQMEDADFWLYCERSNQQRHQGHRKSTQPVLHEAAALEHMEQSEFNAAVAKPDEFSDGEEKSAMTVIGAKAKSKAKPLDTHGGNLEDGFDALFAPFGEELWGFDSETEDLDACQEALDSLDEQSLKVAQEKLLRCLHQAFEDEDFEKAGKARDVLTRAKERLETLSSAPMDVEVAVEEEGTCNDDEDI